jgi:hypothetical protein
MQHLCLHIVEHYLFNYFLVSVLTAACGVQWITIQLLKWGMQFRHVSSMSPWFEYMLTHLQSKVSWILREKWEVISLQIIYRYEIHKTDSVV